MENPKIALVHDWLTGLGGAEKVLKVFTEMFPEAPVYTLFYNKDFTDKFIPNTKIRPSSLQKIYKYIKKQKLLLPMIPSAIELIDLSKFDIVISSSVSFSKGVITGPETTHICYCYSPTRFLWDWHREYSRESKWKTPIKIIQHFFRIWDRHASERVDYFIAISKNVQKRILKYYQRESKVIYSPAEILTPDFNLVKIKKPFYLIVSRLFSHKNIKIAIEAFNKLGYPLIIIGRGPELNNLKKIANKNIKFLGRRSDKEVHSYYASCRAFIMPQEEDFGLTPVEAMSFGKPVLALRKGGALETIIEGVTGEFFDDPIPEALADGIRRLNENYPNYNPATIQKQAEKFSRDRFQEEMLKLVR